MIYVGVAAQLLSMDMEWVEKTVRKQFAKKVKAAELNLKAVHAGYEYAASSLTKEDPFVIEPMSATHGKIIIDGNAAAAMGAMFAGVTVVTWYPITPSSSVVEQLIDYMKKYRIEEDGKANFAIVQAEDELAAVGMVLGAGWAGARSMTATSGPGISLMAEFAGLGYYAEIPGVIFDIQRTGPSTGLPTRTSQGDITFIAGLSQGDTKHVMLMPATVKECFEFAVEAFNIAEQMQTPIFVLSDLDLGMNNWMSEPFEYPEKPIHRGKVLDAKQLESLAGSPATRTWTAMVFRIAHFPAPIILPRRILRAVPATTKRHSIRNARTITKTICCGWRGSSRPRKRWFRSRLWKGKVARRLASSRLAPATLR